MKTIAIDIKHSVFENDTEAIMYITKDIYSDSYIVAVPVITFSWEVADERDLDYLLWFNLFGERDKRERLATAIKKGITEFEQGGDIICNHLPK
ncbi:hypothetical protein ACFSVM_24495 [Paenibacillus shunpengii]|uniref:Uncharacterized protein n=1 Tax=Paenibacillus shunpengii TaxID=2054424 RepID=A0ABW5SV00_9BACL|nr:hypothetical protein [Niallia sp. MER TA 168]MCM3364300.1 hypothetical protein [Niallia sp. MER TA 168]